MTNVFVTSNIVATSSNPENLAGGDSLTVITGVSVVAENGLTCVDYSGGGTFSQIDGSIYGGIALAIGGGSNQIFVGETGLVAGFATAMDLFGGFEDIHNAGEIVSMGAQAIYIQGSTNSIFNGGYISAATYGVEINGGNTQLTNSGTIEGATPIVYHSASGTDIESIVNSGTIACVDASFGGITVNIAVDDANSGTMSVGNSGLIAGGTGVKFNAPTGLIDSLDNTGIIRGTDGEGLDEAGGGSLQVVNAGTISGTVFAIEFGTAGTANSLDNSGRIVGDMTAGLAELSVVNSGHIAGDISFGSAGDSYDGALGSVNGLVNGSGGDDTLSGGAGADHFDGGTGSDILSGAGGNDTLAAEGTTATIDGGDGNDHINMASFFNANDQIDGGSGKDTLNLNGNYATVTVLGADTLTNVEKVVVAAGFSYTFTTDDNNVAAGARLVVDASALVTGQALTFNGSAETDGRFSITGGAGADVLTGGAGNDIFVGNLGKNIFDGGAGADRMTGGGNVDTFVYTDVSDSTSTVRDIVTAFNTVNDKFDLDVTVSNIDAAVTSGRLGAANFDANLTTALSGHLVAGDAIVFTPTIGGLAGHTFLIVDANGVAGYQAGQDYVIELASAGSLGSLSTANFI